MRGQGEEVHVERRRVDGEPADRLARVGVEPDARLASEAGGLGDLLEGPQLVIRVLDGGEQRARRSDLDREAIEVDPAVPVDRDRHDLEAVGLQRVGDASDRRVLDGSEDDPRPELADGPHAAPDRQGDRLRPARREHDLVGLRADRAGDVLARAVEQRAGGPSLGVDVQRIAVEVERGDHRLARLGQQGSGGGRVEVQVGAHRRCSVLGGRPRTTASPAPCPGGTPSCTGRPR